MFHIAIIPQAANSSSCLILPLYLFIILAYRGRIVLLKGVFALFIEKMTDEELVPYRCAWQNIKYGYELREYNRKGHYSLWFDVRRKKHPKRQKKFRAWTHFLKIRENDQCHSYMVLKIYLECSVLCPECFPINGRIVRMIMDHEYDEIAMGGDRLDDGSYDEKKKNAIGIKFAKASYAGYPLEVQQACLEDLEAFQNKTGRSDYACDKFEFAIGLVYRIMRGAKPTLITRKIYESKKKRKKSNDEIYSEKIKSEYSHDIVFASTLDKTMGIEGRKTLIILMELAYQDAGLTIPEGVYAFY